MRSDIHQKNNTTPPADTVPESISLSSDFLSSCENTRVELIKNSNKAKNGTSYAHGHIGRQDATFTSKQESKDQNEMFSAAAEQRCFSLFAFRNLPFLPSFFFCFSHLLSLFCSTLLSSSSFLSFLPLPPTSCLLPASFPYQLYCICTHGPHANESFPTFRQYLYKLHGVLSFCLAYIDLFCYI